MVPKAKKTMMVLKVDRKEPKCVKDYYRTLRNLHNAAFSMMYNLPVTKNIN